MSFIDYTSTYWQIPFANNLEIKKVLNKSHMKIARCTVQWSQEWIRKWVGSLHFPLSFQLNCLVKFILSFSRLFLYITIFKDRSGIQIIFVIFRDTSFLQVSDISSWDPAVPGEVREGDMFIILPHNAQCRRACSMQPRHRAPPRPSGTFSRDIFWSYFTW